MIKLKKWQAFSLEIGIIGKYVNEILYHFVAEFILFLQVQKRDIVTFELCSIVFNFKT